MEVAVVQPGGLSGGGAGAGRRHATGVPEGGRDLAQAEFQGREGLMALVEWGGWEEVGWIIGGKRHVGSTELQQTSRCIHLPFELTATSIMGSCVCHHLCSRSSFFFIVQGVSFFSSPYVQETLAFSHE